MKSASKLNYEDYKRMYQESLDEPEKFWGHQAERLTWFKKWDQVKNTSFHSPVHISWFEGAELNVSYNCVDRHLSTRRDKVALIWESDNPSTPSRKITYGELFKQVNRMATALKNIEVRRGDRVLIYMPMVPETVFAMLACARIGAIHSVVFAGFSADAIADRIQDCDAKLVITADAGLRGGKTVALKENVDAALLKTPHVKNVLVFKNTNFPVNMRSDRDIWFHEMKIAENAYVQPASMSANDPLFILYTSGSTSKPKGVLHSSGGYLLYASVTHHYAFDARDEDIFFCSADVGWVTGHSYIVYGPLANGATSVMFEGVPNYPTPSRFWEIIDKHKVSVFYTAPTAIRALMREGDIHLKSTHRNSLRLLGSVGEPINPEAWQWYFNAVGKSKCPIVDTWWQTETGGVMIAPIPGTSPMKPGSACFPFFGIRARLMSNNGKKIKGPGEGNLVIEDSWPGQMISIYGDHQRFEGTYFSTYKGYYFTGDGCRFDEDGCYWITGRVDDVINVSGHRIGTAEVESALVGHGNVAEAAVVGMPHHIKGQSIYAFVTLKTGFTPSENLRKELIQWVRKEIGSFAAPEIIQWAPKLPKTRSGKIMRRILRKIAENNYQDLGDTSTLSDPSVVEELIQQHTEIFTAKAA